VFYLIALHNFNNFTEFLEFWKGKEIFLLFSQKTANLLVKRDVVKKGQTQLELPEKAMNYTRITPRTDHLKARFP
jgi:hypothetical protein